MRVYTWIQHLWFLTDATNIYIHEAEFTTAHARLALYNLLENLGTRTLYYDTDSVLSHQVHKMTTN